jgi:hypothetical protein
VFLKRNSYGNWITTWQNQLAAQNIVGGKVHWPVNDFGMYQDEKVSAVEHYIQSQMN